jgi:hypothetical protein
MRSVKEKTPSKSEASLKQNEATETETETEKKQKRISVATAPASWSREACDDHAERYGGVPPGGQIGKALKPLVTKHGWPIVRPAWRRYLAETEAQYSSPSRFAATFGQWTGGRSSQDGPQYMDLDAELRGE